MNIQTECGIQIFCLPDYAKCKYTGKSPEKMDSCPIHRIDKFGEICIPEICEKYEENKK